MKADQEFSCWACRIEVAKADGRSGDKTEIHRIKPMVKWFVEEVAKGIYDSEVKDDFSIVDKEKRREQKRPTGRPKLVPAVKPTVGPVLPLVA